LLKAEQIAEYELPPMMGKATDTRAARFVEQYGQLIQVELDALPPDVLRQLYAAAVERFFDMSQYHAVMEHETRDREELV
jgi:hypothetical protein